MNCRICNDSSMGQSMYQVTELKHGTHDRFQYFQCPACGCIQIADFPANISQYYAFEHGLLVEGKAGSMQESISRFINIRKPLWHIYATLRFRSLSKLVYRLFPYQPVRIMLDKPKQVDILDVGCNAGLLLYGLKNAGYANVTGIDPFINTESIDYQNGLRIFKKMISEFDGHDLFDVIMFHHSFEHIPDQLKTLLAAFRLLKNEGTCFLRLPVISYYMMKHYGTFWVHWDAPRHYFQHTVKSIRMLAEEAGFRVEKIIHESKFTSLLWSELYKQNLSLAETLKYILNPWNYSKVYGFIRKVAELNKRNEADCVAVYLTKIK